LAAAIVIVVLRRLLCFPLACNQTGVIFPPANIQSNARHNEPKQNTAARALAAISCLLLLSCVTTLCAGSLDPRIVVGDPTGGTPVASANFWFTADAHGGGILNFINNSRHTWTTLDFFVTLPSADTIGCSSTWYSFCSFTETSLGNGQSQFDIGFEQPTQAGILPGSSFSLDLDDSPGVDKGSWGPFAQVQAVANFDIPEPSALFLATAGLICCILIAAYRRVSS
jgi:hypothetical protein